MSTETNLKTFAENTVIENTPVQQIYNIVNSVVAEITGQQTPAVVDTHTFVATGEKIIKENQTDRFNNGLARRIARTIIVSRKYRTKFASLSLTDFEYGAIVQKITIDMPDAVPDASWELIDGQSVDQYIINKPKYSAKYFENETPYSYFVTLSTFLLKTAFLNEGVMATFIAAIYAKMRQALDMALEGLGRNAIASMIVNSGVNQVFNLVSYYNTIAGKTLTASTAVFDPDFMRWASGFINALSDKMEENTVLYNTERTLKFTPKDLQRFIVPIDFYYQFKTVSYYSAYNQQDITVAPSMRLSGWQSPTDPYTVRATNKDGTAVTMSNVVGMIFDRDALGTYMHDEEVLTTPVNARGRYYNTYYHGRQLWFNDLAENAVVLTLN